MCDLCFTLNPYYINKNRPKNTRIELDDFRPVHFSLKACSLSAKAANPEEATLWAMWDK